MAGRRLSMVAFACDPICCCWVPAPRGPSPSLLRVSLQLKVNSNQLPAGACNSFSPPPGAPQTTVPARSILPPALGVCAPLGPISAPETP